MKKIYVISVFNKEGVECTRNSFSTREKADEFFHKVEKNTNAKISTYTNELDEEFNEADYYYI